MLRSVLAYILKIKFLHHKATVLKVKGQLMAFCSAMLGDA